jgi:hypothetical protein
LATTRRATLLTALLAACLSAASALRLRATRFLLATTTLLATLQAALLTTHNA